MLTASIAVLLFVVAYERRETNAAGFDCVPKWLTSAECGKAVAATGYVIKPITDCLVTNQKICDINKNQLCAQKLVGGTQSSGTKGVLNLGPVGGILPECRPLPPACQKVCPGGGSSGPAAPSSGSSSAAGSGSCGDGDKHKFCCYWAQAGECDKNSQWMKPNCADSCGDNGQQCQDACKWKFQKKDSGAGASYGGR